MKKEILATSLVLASLTQAGFAEESKTEELKLELHKYDKSKEVSGPEDYFTGNVTVGEVFTSGDNLNDYGHATITFQLGARTAWHTHPRGQTLIITSGEGRVQVEGEEIQTVKKGDVVWFPANTRHWHGAGINTSMTHIAIQAPNEEGNVVNWMEHVTDKDYLGNDSNK
jgi:quercetin dioxygenase-like cupin family protein